MAKSYTINIVNGKGEESVLNDTYAVEGNVTGYDNTSILPNNITVDGTTTTYNFTISAEGTLTLHVTEDGTTTGTPVVGATFNRTDQEGNNKQIASDGNHNFDNTVKNITLTTQTETIEIENTAPTLQTFNLTDANYEGLTINTGTINLS